MIEELIRRLFGGRRLKQFAAWQIELTTRCPLCCRMCVRTGCEDWQQADMSLDDFRKILPYLKDVETVVLEGWGESLLHPDLLEIIRLVKGEGPEVGFVTSGWGLSELRVRELVGAGVDFVGFSLAGATAQTHDRIRVNSHFEDVLRAVRWFQEVKAMEGMSRPKLHFVYLMLKDNVAETSLIPPLAADLGVSEVVLLNIIHVSASFQDEERVFACRPGESDHADILKRTAEIARKLKVNLKRPSMTATEVSVCEENPLRNLYISVNGEVSPCVYLNPPVSSPFRRIFCGVEHWTERVTFGNIFRGSLDSIWKDARYTAFRNCFSRRQSLFERTYTTLPDQPESCKACHKMLGV
jgi:MoaA/NifB/PqqE/SkfB family radical SAM enzyme